jgi:hypothetical protein
MSGGGAGASQTNIGNKYLEYLDKEMTIMGILSTFSVAVVALVLDRVGSAGAANKESFFYVLWHGLESHYGQAGQALYIVIGSFSVSLSALLFYSQRSMLAWFYGQISLSIESPEINGIDTEDWYRDADSWATWTLYQLAFTALILGFVLYGYAIVRAVGLLAPPSGVFWSLIILTVIVQGIRMSILRRYKYHDDPQWELLEWWLCKRLRPKPFRLAIRKWYRRKHEQARRGRPPMMIKSSAARHSAP